MIDFRSILVHCYQEYRGFSLMTASFLVFLLCRGLLYIMIDRSKWTVKRRNLFYNHSISYLHSVVSSIAVLYLFTQHKDLIHEMIGFYNPSGVQLAQDIICFSTGYFAYDTFDMAYHGVYADSVGIWIHHILVLTCFVSAVTYNLFGAYLAFNLIVEINNIFLHQRKLAVLSSDSGQPAKDYAPWFKWNTVLLFCTFIPFRFVPNGWLQFKVWQDRLLFKKVAAQQNSSNLPGSWYLAFVGMLLLNLYNVMFFIQLVQAEFKLSKGGKTQDNVKNKQY